MIRFQGRILDIRILGPVLGLIVIGLICQFSAVSGMGSEGIGSILTSSFGRQLIWLLVGLGVWIALFFSPPGMLYRSAFFGYGFSLILLAAVLILPSAGVHRWFRIGSVGFQPSELAKAATVICLARVLAEERSEQLTVKRMLQGALLTGGPFLLILREPDVGTAAVLVFTCWMMMVWAGMGWRRVVLMIIPFLALGAGFVPWIFIVFLVGLVGLLIWFKKRWWIILFSALSCSGLALLGPTLWSRLQDYQQQRILTFLGAASDPHGAAYQVIQSKVAIGSGGIFGKGYLRGSQTHLRFLPEQHTDFVFSVLGEEFGFFGVSVVLMLFLVLFLRLLYTAEKARTHFDGLVVIGSLSVLIFQVVINVGMTIGLVPVTGLPVPFLSYGGSSLIVSMALIGMSMVVTSRQTHF